MQVKISERKLLLALIVFIIALGLMFYNVFYNSLTNTKMFYVILSIALGRFSVLLLKKSKTRANKYNSQF
jgi:hypothetical protein